MLRNLPRDMRWEMRAIVVAIVIAGSSNGADAQQKSTAQQKIQRAVEIAQQKLDDAVAATDKGVSDLQQNAVELKDRTVDAVSRGVGGLEKHAENLKDRALVEADQVQQAVATVAIHAADGAVQAREFAIGVADHVVNAAGTAAQSAMGTTMGVPDPNATPHVPKIVQKQHVPAIATP